MLLSVLNTTPLMTEPQFMRTLRQAKMMLSTPTAVSTPGRGARIGVSYVSGRSGIGANGGSDCGMPGGCDIRRIILLLPTRANRHWKARRSGLYCWFESSQGRETAEEHGCETHASNAIPLA